MSSVFSRWGLYIVTVICLLYVFMLVSNGGFPDFASLNNASVQSFKIMFISIVLEAFPFILLGVVISAVLQTFVSEQTIARLVPKNPLLGILYACIIGIIFPICECGMIPIMRRLLRKGMPLYIAVVFIVAGPILNPIVFASTYMAFRSRPEIAYSRMALAFACAVVIGLIIYRFIRSNPLRGFGLAGQAVSANAVGTNAVAHAHASAQEHVHAERHHSHEHAQVHGHAHGHTHTHTHAQAHADSRANLHTHTHTHAHGGKLNTIMTHASDEFFEMGKYLVFGALLAALVQTVMSREWLVSVGTGEWSSHLFMMGFAYVISLCSTSDAFVASSFVSVFSAGSLLSFLVFGPMLDIKGTLMLLAIFRTRFVIMLSAIIFVTVLAASMLLERMLFM